MGGLGELPQVAQQRRALGVGLRPRAGLRSHLLERLDVTVDLRHGVGDGIGPGRRGGQGEIGALALGLGQAPVKAANLAGLRAQLAASQVEVLLRQLEQPVEVGA
jgi:hypothetical protein